ncbi:MAG: hypothetical protein Q4A32_03485 [Lachnospiraceae bacterium]|nr:hypothetical protein [Lachnospiraceae bacterium]
MIIQAWVETGISGSRDYFDFEVDDHATDEDIECDLDAEVWNHISTGWEISDGK